MFGFIFKINSSDDLLLAKTENSGIQPPSVWCMMAISHFGAINILQVDSSHFEFQVRRLTVGGSNTGENLFLMVHE